MCAPRMAWWALENLKTLKEGFHLKSKYVVVHQAYIKRDIYLEFENDKFIKTSFKTKQKT